MDAFAVIKKIIRIYVYMLIIAWIVLSITFWVMIKQSDEALLNQTPINSQQLTGPHRAHGQMINGINKIETTLNYSIDRSSEIMHQITESLPFSQSISQSINQGIDHWNITLKSFFQEVCEVARYAADEWLEEALNLSNNQQNRQSNHQRTTKPIHKHQQIKQFDPSADQSISQPVDRQALHSKPITKLTRSEIRTLLFDESPGQPNTQTVMEATAALYISPARSNDQSFKLSTIQSIDQSKGSAHEVRVALSIADGIIRVTQKTPYAA